MGNQCSQKIQNTHGKKDSIQFNFGEDKLSHQIQRMLYCKGVNQKEIARSKRVRVVYTKEIVPEPKSLDPVPKGWNARSYAEGVVAGGKRMKAQHETTAVTAMALSCQTNADIQRQRWTQQKTWYINK
jgi:hypothetical protein